MSPVSKNAERSKNIERDICQIEIIPEVSPIKKSSSKGTFSKKRTLSNHKSSKSASKINELLSDESNKVLFGNKDSGK